MGLRAGMLELAKEYENSFIKGDVEYLKRFVERVSNPEAYQRYLGNLVATKITDLTVTVVELEDQGDKGSISLKLEFEFKNINPHTVYHTLEIINENGKLYVTRLRQNFDLENAEVGITDIVIDPFLNLPTVSTLPQDIFFNQTAFFELIDPESPVEYSKVILKWHRYILKNPIYNTGIIIANMMSPLTQMLAEKVKDPSQNNTVENLNRFTNRYVKHLHQIFTPGQDPWKDSGGYPSSPGLIIEEMFGLYKDLQVVGAFCQGIQFLIAAVLRSTGISSTNIWQLRLSQDDREHDYTIVRTEDAYFLGSNHVLMRVDNSFVNNYNIVGIYNDIYFSYVNGINNMNASLLRKTLKESRKISRQFGYGRSFERVTNYVNYQKGYPSIDIALEDPDRVNKYQNLVFEQSRKDPYSPFTFARYSYQTMYVKKPEAYLIASERSPQTRTYASEFNTVAEVIQWLQDNVQEGSIFNDTSRVMFSEQVIIYRLGRSKDLAVTLASFLKLLKIPCYTLWTQDHGYVIYKENTEWKMFDMTRYKEVSTITENINAIFNTTQCYYPLMGRNEPTDEIKELIDLFNLTA